MNSDRLSVCIVTYNSADKIVNTLRAIYSLSDERIIVYISDNNSSDDTVELVRKNFPQAIIVENADNKGFAHGNNAVLPLISSKYHFIVNPDIIVKYNVFAEFSKYFDDNPEVVMAVPKFLFENGTEQFTPKLEPKIRYMIGGRFEKFGNPFRRWRDEYTLRKISVSRPIEIGFCSGCFICVKTDIFKKMNGFDERYFLYNEDADITREAKYFGKTMYNPNISVVHTWERAYMRNKKYFFIQLQSMVKYFWKWRGNGRHTHGNV